LAEIEKSAAKLAEKGKITAAQAAGVKSNLGICERVEAGEWGELGRGVEGVKWGDGGLVIEAIYESFEAKAALYKQIMPRLRPDAIIASNTSSISITKLAAATDRPARFIGMHFFNPVPIMVLVEVIRGLATDDATCETIEALAKRMGKTPLRCNDMPG